MIGNRAIQGLPHGYLSPLRNKIFALENAHGRDVNELMSEHQRPDDKWKLPTISEIMVNKSEQRMKPK